MKIESFSPIATHDSKVLILGTMPSKESLNKQEYYAHPKNHFWDIIYRVCNPNWDFFQPVQEFEEYSSKIELLKINKIALWDTLKYCEREGSLDKNIRNELKNEFKEFFQNHPFIRLVIFNGLNADKFFNESNKEILSTNNITSLTLNSTSSSNSKNTFSILNQWKNALKKGI